MKLTVDVNKPSQLLTLTPKSFVSKRNLFDLIQFSKQTQSEFYEEPDWIINNTPQQGINWIGKFPKLKAVIIKTKIGSYAEDGWKDNEKTIFSYSFKAKKGIISYNDTANKSLINQQVIHYPILLFIESLNNWSFEGLFTVTGMDNSSVILKKILSLQDLPRDYSKETPLPKKNDKIYLEGERKFVTHLLAERNTQVIKELKTKTPWVCDICNLEFIHSYSKNYIEAHHKKPLHTYKNSHAVTTHDFVLLCPNCHKAVHIMLREDNLEYVSAKEKILSLLNKE